MKAGVSKWWLVPWQDLPKPTLAWLLLNAETDFMFAQQTIDFALTQQEGTPLHQQLGELAVIRYCRPFTQCKLPCGRHSTLIPEDAVPPGVHPGAAQFNAEWLARRDVAVAHTDFSSRELYLTRFPPRDASDPKLGRVRVNYEGLFPDSPSLRLAATIADHYRRWLKHMLADLVEQHFDLPMLEPRSLKLEAPRAFPGCPKCERERADAAPA